MRLTTTDNVAQAEANIDALLARILESALPRAANTLRDQAQTAGYRKINEVYDIPARTMDQYTTLKVSTPNDLEASITVKGRGFPLSTLRPVQTKQGVTILIKRRRVLVPHAFMVARFGQHVFARGSYGGKGAVRPTGESFGRFVFGSGRLPISELYSFAPPDCLSNNDVRQTMDDRVEQQAPAVLKRELAAVARGF